MTVIEHVAESEEVSFFSPQNCSFQALEKTLTSSRRKVAETLLKRIRGTVKKPVSEHTHLLLTGTEGAGKTHVLAYVAGRLRDEFDVEELTLIPLFDENREIANLFDFLVTCIRAAGHFSEEELLERIEDFDGDLIEGASDLFAEMTHGTRAVIIVEGFDQLLSSLDKSGPKALRNFLDTHPSLTLLASSPGPVAAKGKHPFKGALETHALVPMGIDEAADFVRMVLGGPADTTQWLPSGLNGEAFGTFAAFHQLCDGNHRLLTMLAAFLETGRMGDSVEDFVKMVEYCLTPYYQQSVERLSNQQLKILLAILRNHGKAMTVKDISRRVFLPSQTVSRQLYDLLNGDYVARTQVGRESFYEIRSPLFRAVLEASHGTSAGLEDSVRFLTYWHQCSNLLEGDSNGTTSAKDCEGLLNELQAVIDAGDPVEDPATVAQAYVDKAAVQGELGRHDEAVSTADEFLEGPGTAPKVQIHVAQALLNKGADFTSLQRLGKAIETFREVRERFGDTKDSRFGEFLLRAHLHAAECHLMRGENLEALDELDQAAALRPADPAVQGQRVQILFELRRDGEAFRIVSDRLLDKSASWAEQAVFARNLIYLFVGKERLLGRIAGIYSDHSRFLAMGLILWCQEHLPVSADNADAVVEIVDAIAPALEAVDEGKIALHMLRTECRSAAGDPRALLEIPVEIRRLAHPHK